MIYYGFHPDIKLVDMNIFTYIYSDCYIIIGSIEKKSFIYGYIITCGWGEKAAKCLHNMKNT